MKNIRRLKSPQNIVNNRRESKVKEMPKVHTAKNSNAFRGISPSSPSTTWCGLMLHLLPPLDEYILEKDYLFYLEIGLKNKPCSCCDNAIQRSIKQRMLGI